MVSGSAASYESILSFLTGVCAIMCEELDTVPSAPKRWLPTPLPANAGTLSSGAELSLIYLLGGEVNTNEVIPSPSKVRTHSTLTGMIYCQSAVRDSDMLTYSQWQ